MVGFADGFAQGFNMVDSALARRRQQDLEEERMNKEDERYKAHLAYQQGRDTVTDQHWKNEFDQKTADSAADNKRADQSLTEQIRQHIDENDYRNKSLEETKRQHDASIGIQKAQLGISAQNARTSAAQAQASINLHNAEISKINYAIDSEKRKDAMLRVQSMIGQPDKDGNVPITYSEDPAIARKQLDDVGVALQIDVGKMYKDPEKTLSHVSALKHAMATPGYADQNNTKVLGALNYLYDKEINNGIGEEYAGADKNLAGGVVVSKKIVGVMPANIPDMPGATVPIIQSTVRKDGKDYQAPPAPMTQNRTTDPNDPIKVLTVQDKIKKIEGVEALGQIILMNPGQAKYINEYVLSDKDRAEQKQNNAAADLYKEQHPDASEKTLNAIRSGVDVAKQNEKAYDLSLQKDAMGGTAVLRENKRDGTGDLYLTGPDGKQTVQHIGTNAAEQSQQPAGFKAGDKKQFKQGMATFDGKNWVLDSAKQEQSKNVDQPKTQQEKPDTSKRADLSYEHMERKRLLPIAQKLYPDVALDEVDSAGLKSMIERAQK